MLADLSSMSDVTSWSHWSVSGTQLSEVFLLNFDPALLAVAQMFVDWLGVLIEVITPRVTHANKSRDWKLLSLGFCYCCCFVAGDRWTGMSMLRSPIVTMTDALPTKDWELLGGVGRLMFCVVACFSVLPPNPLLLVISFGYLRMSSFLINEFFS